MRTIRALSIAFVGTLAAIGSTGCAPTGGVSPAAFPNQPIGCPNGMPSLPASCCDAQGNQIKFDSSCGGFTRDAKPMSGIQAGAAQAASAGGRAIASANELVGDAPSQTAAASSGGVLAEKPVKADDVPVGAPDLAAQSQRAKERGGSGGGSAAAGGGGPGGGSVRPTTELRAPPSHQLASTETTGSAYAGGGGGGARARAPGDGMGDVFGSGGLAANGGTIEMSSPERFVQPMLAADPEDYFQRVAISDNLFQVIERRYRQKANAWATSNAQRLSEQVRNPVSP